MKNIIKDFRNVIIRCVDPSNKKHLENIYTFTAYNCTVLSIILKNISDLECHKITFDQIPYLWTQY